MMNFKKSSLMKIEFDSFLNRKPKKDLSYELPMPKDLNIS
jgi:hypothetical protein